MTVTRRFTVRRKVITKKDRSMVAVCSFQIYLPSSRGGVGDKETTANNYQVPNAQVAPIGR